MHRNKIDILLPNVRKELFLVNINRS